MDFLTYEEKFKLELKSGGGRQMKVYSKKAKEIFSDSMKSDPITRDIEIGPMQKNKSDAITVEDIRLLQEVEAAEIRDIDNIALMES